MGEEPEDGGIDQKACCVDKEESYLHGLVTSTKDTRRGILLDLFWFGE